MKLGRLRLALAPLRWPLHGFVDGIPAPLGIGKVKLADGSWVRGFVCEAIGVEGGTEITTLASWRAWLAQQG